MQGSSTEFLWGLGFVALYAYGRFRGAGEQRIVTTHGRYWTALILYVLFYAVLFLVIALLVTIGSNLPHGWDQMLAQWEKLNTGDLGSYSPPLIAALLMTVLLPQIGPLARRDEQIREFFRRMAALSRPALELSRQLQKARLSMSGDDRAAMEETLTSHGFDAQDLSFDADDTPQHMWVRLAYYWAELRDWNEASEPYQRFVKTRLQDYQSLKLRYTEFNDDAKHCFRLYRASAGDAELAQALSACKKQYCSRMAKLLQQTCDFLSEGILYTQPGRDGRRKTIRSLIEMQAVDVGLSIHEVARLFIGLVVGLVVAFLVIHHFSAPASLEGEGTAGAGRRILLAIMVATNYSIAVLCAIATKYLYRTAANETPKSRPWAAYGLSGLMAVLLGSTLGILYNGVVRGSMGAGFDHFLNATHPWMVMPLVTAIVTAYMTDNPVCAGSRRSQQLKEGSQQAAWTLLGALVVYLWLPRAPPLATMFLVSGGVGFFIGYTVPTWFRGAPMENATDDSVASTSTAS